MPEGSRPALAARRGLAWSVAWIVAAALYLLLIDTTSLPELLVGAGGAVLAATGLELAREQGIVGEGVRAHWLLRLYRPLVKVPADIVYVSWMAVRAVVRRELSTGTFRAVPFRMGEREQLARGQRALAEAFGSFAPNTIVVGVDPEREVILAHQLRRTGDRDAIDLLRLG